MQPEQPNQTVRPTTSQPQPPEPAAAVPSPIYPTPTSHTMPMPAPPETWQPSTSAIEPTASLLLAGLAFVATLCMFTVGLGMNIWLKLVMLVALSGASVYFGIRNHYRNTDIRQLFGLIVGTIILVGSTLVLGAAAYYDHKLRQTTRNYNSSIELY